MRDYILLYVNGSRHIIRGEDAFLSLSDYLRYKLRLTGTKVVCAEGDCGACTIMQGSIHEQSNGKLNYKHINSCISFVNILDCSHIITVEGLKNGDELHPVQEAFVNFQGGQCGFCTPGFVCAMTATFENRMTCNKPIDEKKLINGLSGNLCRCTGYEPIIKAGMNVDTTKMKTMRERYHSPEMMKDFEDHKKQAIKIHTPEKNFYGPTTLQDALENRHNHQEAKMISSATDLGVLINKDKFIPETLLNLNHVSELYEVKIETDKVIVGAKVNLYQLEQALKNVIPEFSSLIHIFASPQIKNAATLVGNIANGSPIADTTPALFVLEAKVEIQNSSDSRFVNMKHFYKGYKHLDLKPDELITSVHIPIPTKDQVLKLFKVSNRKDMDISTVTFAALMTRDANNQDMIKDMRMAYGGVGPLVKRVTNTENFLKGKPLTLSTMKDAGHELLKEISPISDVRSSKDYRNLVAKNLLEKFYYEVSAL